MEKTPHIAIVEDEFLIAVDAEYLIREAMACNVCLVRPDRFVHWTDRDLSALSLCLMDMSMQTKTSSSMARRLQNLGIPLVFTSVSDSHRQAGVEAFEGVPVVMKPFDGEALLAAVEMVMPDASACQN